MASEGLTTEGFEKKSSQNFDILITNYSSDTALIEDYEKYLRALEVEKQRLLNEVETFFKDSTYSRDKLVEHVTSLHKEKVEELMHLREHKSVSVELTTAFSRFKSKKEDALLHGVKNDDIFSVEAEINRKQSEYFTEQLTEVKTKKARYLLKILEKAEKELDNKIQFAEKTKLIASWKTALDEYARQKQLLNNELADLHSLASVLDLSDAEKKPIDDLKQAIETSVEQYDKDSHLTEFVENDVLLKEKTAKLTALQENLNAHAAKIKEEMVKLKLSIENKIKELEAEVKISKKKTGELNSKFELIQHDVLNVKAKVSKQHEDLLETLAERNTELEQSHYKEIKKYARNHGGFSWFWKLIDSAGFEKNENIYAKYQQQHKVSEAVMDALTRSVDRDAPPKKMLELLTTLQQHREHLSPDVALKLEAIHGSFRLLKNYEDTKLKNKDARDVLASSDSRNENKIEILKKALESVDKTVSEHLQNSSASTFPLTTQSK